MLLKKLNCVLAAFLIICSVMLGILGVEFVNATEDAIDYIYVNIDSLPKYGKRHKRKHSLTYTLPNFSNPHIFLSTQVPLHCYYTIR